MTIIEVIKKHLETGKRFTNSTIGRWLTVQDGFLHANTKFTPTAKDLTGSDWKMEKV